MSLRSQNSKVSSQVPVVLSHKRPHLNSELVDIVAAQFNIPPPFCSSLQDALGDASKPITFVVIDIENYPNIEQDPRFKIVMKNNTSQFVVTASYSLELLKRLHCEDRAVFCDHTVRNEQDAADTHLIMLAQTMFMLSNLTRRTQDKFVVFSNDHVFKNMAWVMDSNFHTWADDGNAPPPTARVRLCSGLAKRADANAPPLQPRQS